MCRTPKLSSPICIYCGNTNHRSAKCEYRPWDNRKQPRPKSDALRNQQNQQANTKILASAHRNLTSSSTNLVNHENLSPSSPRMTSQGTSTKHLGNTPPNTNGSRENNSNNLHSRQNQKNQNNDEPHVNTTNTESSGGSPPRGQPMQQQQHNSNQFSYRDFGYYQQRHEQQHTWF